jgi:hypothetical protein
MRRSLIVAVLLLSGFLGNAQELRVVIRTAPEPIKKAALAMFVRHGYSIDSDTQSQLKLSKPFSEDETAAYNTAHWTNQPVANCRHVHTFLLSPTDAATSVTMATEMVCHYNGLWMIRRDANETDIQFIHSTLADLRARIEETNQRR